MNDPVLTHASPGIDRRGRRCFCSRCGTVERCRPAFDFYTLDNNLLACEECLRVKLHAQAVVTPL